MLGFVRGVRSVLVAIAAADPALSVGPTSISGWTAMEIESPEDLPASASAVLLEEYDREVELVVRDGTFEEHFMWRTGPTGPSSLAVADLERMADALARLEQLSASDRSAVLALVAERSPADVLVDALGRAVGLPDIRIDVPERAIVLARLPERKMRATGSMAARHLGRTSFSDLGDGWTALVPEESPEASHAVARAVGLGLRAGNVEVSRRRALLLWSGGDVRGAAVLRGDEVSASTSWGSQWEQPALAGWVARGAIADEFAAFGDAGTVDCRALRSHLRSTSPAGDPLDVLVSLLGAPSSALAILDEQENAPARGDLVPTGFFLYFWALLDVRAFLSDPPRGWQLLLGGLALALALVSLLMCGVEASVILSDGASVDQAGATAEDWGFLVLFALLAVLHSVFGVTILSYGLRSR